MSENEAKHLTLDVQALVRAVGVNSDIPHSLFLGAGASISSGVPSANACIWEWKRRLFLSTNPDLEGHLGDAASPSTRDRVQRWIDQHPDFPSLDSPHEYGKFAELCFPIPEDRRRFFDQLTRKAEPYLGYAVLALLADARVVRSLWTTNFDALATRAISGVNDLSVVEVGLDAPSRAVRIPDEGEFLHVAIHGDYRYDHLKNTESEIQAQDATLRAALTNTLAGSHLVVVGFSGRDEAVMKSLTEAYSHPGAGRLYWCGFGAEAPHDAIRNLLKHARSHGREAFYVSTDGFDDLVLRIAAHCLDGERQKEALSLRTEFLEKSQEGRAKLSLPSSNRVVGLVKSNLFPVECPTDLFAFEPDFDDGWWKEIRRRCEGTNVFAVPFAKRVFALGAPEDIVQAFAGAMKDNPKLVPLDAKAQDSGAIQSLFEEAILDNFASKKGLHRERSVLFEPTSHSQRAVYGQRVEVHKGVVTRLRKDGSVRYLSLVPTVVGRTQSGEVLEKADSQELRRSLLSSQYNKVFNEDLQFWRKRLFDETGSSFAISLGENRVAPFHVERTPVFAKVVGKIGREISIPKSALRHAVQTAVVVDEPKLAFSRRDGSGIVLDSHPMRGIRDNQPLDYPLNQTVGLSSGIRVGLVCPEKYSQKVSRFLGGLHSPTRLPREDEYLLDFPGFSQAFGTPIQIASSSDPEFASPTEIAPQTTAKQGAHKLGEALCRAIDRVAEVQPHVIVIYVPQEWRQWEGYDDENEWFDLHDYVKAYCVQRGICTQFLRESTVSKSTDVSLLWCLSLSFYAKSMRTPWALAGGDGDTAYIGIGYSLAPGARPNSRILLGCSHIYGTDGLGLQYRLSKIDSPIFVQRNPHLRRDDARRIAELARQSFFEQNGRLPKRIAIHKRTPFLKEERQGFVEGLHGVKSIDLVEITVDPAARYLASKLHNGRFEGDHFPVWRGTTIKTGDYEALLFGHGSTAALKANRRFYQGRSRIPAPLRLVRHAGTTALVTLAEEILALTKMNWNNFNLYDRVPATIESSSQIARIGSLLGPLTPRSYDYRLFI